MARLIRPFAGDRSLRIARALIGEFGTLGNVLEVSAVRLELALPDDPDVIEQIAAARELVQQGLRQQVLSSQIDAQDRNMQDYLRNCLGNSSEERLAAVFASSAGCYLADEVVGVGNNASVHVCMRTLFRRALDLGARALLLAHNHPSGRLTPSKSDIINTRELQRVAQSLNIVLIDHLIITATGAFSMKSGRVL